MNGGGSNPLCFHMVRHNNGKCYSRGIVVAKMPNITCNVWFVSKINGQVLCVYAWCEPKPMLAHSG